MKVFHTQPKKLTEEQREKLDTLTSDSMDLYFKLQDDNVEDADLVLIRGVEIYEIS